MTSSSPTESKLAADQLAADPRVAEAKKLLAAALTDAQQSLAGVRPADPARAEQLNAVYQHFGQVRGGALPLNYLGSGLGKGALVELLDGSVKYDLINGIGVHGLGHSDPGLLSAAIDGALGDTIMQGNLQQNAESKDLCDDLVKLANCNGAKLNHCFLTTAGSMANENAIKLIFQKHAPATHMLAFSHSFCGRTLAMAALTDKHLYRDGLPETLRVHYLPFFKADDKAKSIDAAVKHLQLHVKRYPGKIAGAMFEMIQGEGGYNAGDADYFRALMAECKANNIAVLVDEIQSFARASQPFAFQHYGLDDLVDVVSVGKLSQVCATLFTDHYVPRPGLISQTFTGATTQIFAAREMLRRMQAEQWFGENGLNQKVRGQFAEHFAHLHRKHPGLIAGQLFGEGAMIGFEVFAGDADKTKQVMNTLYDLGVICFLCGASPMRLRFLPPVSKLSEADITTVMSLVEQALEQVAGA